MFSGYKMVIDDPSKFELLTEDMKKTMLKAAVNTVNMQAALTRKNAIQNIQQSFTLRNTFTQRQIAFDRCTIENPTSFSEIESHVGAREKIGYMARQESGGTHTAANGGQLAIPSDAARGGTNKNPVQRNMYRAKVNKKIVKYNPQYKGTGKSALVSAAESAYTGGKFLKYNKNIYKVTAFRKTGDNISFELELLYNRHLSSTETKAEPWLEPAAQKPAQDAQSIFNSQMNKLDK
jgi:hypothetical protein